MLSPSGDSATPLGNYKLALNKILLPTFHHRKVTPRRAGVQFMPLHKAPPPGAHKPALNSHNKSQFLFPNKAHYLYNSRPISSQNVNFPLKKVNY